MNQRVVGNGPALLLKQTDRTFQVDRVPEDDCGHYQARPPVPVSQSALQQRKPTREVEG